MEPDGSGVVAGAGAVYFLRTPGPPDEASPESPRLLTALTGPATR